MVRVSSKSISATLYSTKFAHSLSPAHKKVSLSGLSLNYETSVFIYRVWFPCDVTLTIRRQMLFECFATMSKKLYK